jgi:hypothetical protein
VQRVQGCPPENGPDAALINDRAPLDAARLALDLDAQHVVVAQALSLSAVDDDCAAKLACDYRHA